MIHSQVPKTASLLGVPGALENCSAANGLLQRKEKTSPSPGSGLPRGLPFLLQGPFHHCPQPSPNSRPSPSRPSSGPGTSAFSWRPGTRPTCFGVYVSWQVWRRVSRGEVFIAVRDERRERVDMVRVLHDRHFVRLREGKQQRKTPSSQVPGHRGPVGPPTTPPPSWTSLRCTQFRRQPWPPSICQR